MHTEQSFIELEQKLLNAGVSADKVAEYAASIGDTPFIEDGLVLVFNDDGEVIDRVAIPLT